jgi:hypothetical protein
MPPTAIQRFGLLHYQVAYVGDTIWIPPATAFPTVEGSAIVLYPQPLGISGSGTPMRSVGKPRSIIRRPFISIESAAADTRGGYQWYQQFLDNNTTQKVWGCFFDPRYSYSSGGFTYYGGWRVYICIMHWPVITEIGKPVDVATSMGFQCEFTELTVAAAANDPT